MPIFKIERQKVQRLGLKRDGFGSEFELRDFFATNLEEILGIRFLEKEYPTTDGRIDTLGIDENDSPVIIEYKWKENEEVLSQGLFYLDWLLKNKKHFELLVQSKLGGKTDVNWDQPRVILIAQGFSRYVRAAAQRVESVELKTYALYEGDVLNLENEYSPQLESSSPNKEKELHEDKKIYNLNYHLNNISPEMRKAFSELRDRILQLPDVEEVSEQKTGPTYRTTKSFTRLEFKKTWIQVLLRGPRYEEDALGLVKDITSLEYGYKGLVKFVPDTNLDYLFSLIRASYNSTL